MEEVLQTQPIPTEENKDKKVKKELYIVGGRKRNTYRVSWKSFIVAAILVGFVFTEAVMQGSYIDEVLGLASLGYLTLFNSRIKRYDLLTFSFIVVILFIGFVSNLFSDVGVLKSSIAIDAITQLKVILSFFFIKYFLSDGEKQATLEMFTPIAKLFCLVTFFFSILTQFVNTGMSPDERYGMHCFNFIFAYNFEYIATYMIVFGVIVCSNKLTAKQKAFYYFLGSVSVGLNLKSEALIFTFLFVFLFFYFRKNEKIKPYVILIIAAGVFLLGQYQIDTYLAKDNTARHVFFEYAVKNANHYFPLGSGFATYGSAEASKHYSPLYYRYGFTDVWGMSPDFRAFLTDTYWASVLGQFGWIGALLMVIVYIRVFVSFTNSNFRFDQKAFLYACFGQYVIHAIGSGIITSSSGMMGFIAMALCTQNEVNVNQTFNLPKIRVRM